LAFFSPPLGIRESVHPNNITSVRLNYRARAHQSDKVPVDGGINAHLSKSSTRWQGNYHWAIPLEGGMGQIYLVVLVPWPVRVNVAQSAGRKPQVSMGRSLFSVAIRTVNTPQMPKNPGTMSSG
jgi:hypothetical protein